jgi:spermidine synthase
VSDPLPPSPPNPQPNSQPNPPGGVLSQQQRLLLLIAAAVSSITGLAVELLLGTLASYLVGNQALSYGLAVGGFLAAMGIGAYLSRWVAQKQLLQAFVTIELLIAPLSALLPLSLFGLFVIDGPFWVGLILVTLILGTLAGMEVPILTRILEPEDGVSDALAGVLALDYLGALLGSLLCPVLLLPWLGLFPAAAVIGALPAFMVFALSRSFPKLWRWRWLGLGLGLGLLVLAPFTLPLGDTLENQLYQAPIISRFQSAYQRIVLTRRGKDVRLFLDGDLQLSTLDEYRYHEALVHPALSANLAALNPPNATPAATQRQVLLLGAGDGMAVREILKWPDVGAVTLIELDPAVINFGQHHPALVKANQNALLNPKVTIEIADAFTAAPMLPQQFDVIIADFPDPDRAILAKLYAQGFYQRLLSRLKPEGVFVTQASSPFFAPKVFACITATLKSVGLIPYPYLAEVPSFGPWGFVIASRQPLPVAQLSLPIATRYLTVAMLSNLFELPADLQPQLGQVKINRLIQPVITEYQNDPRWEGYE